MDGVDYLPEPLTEREQEILRLLAEGLSNREIAQKLVIAPETVKWYNKQIYNKLDVHSREQAVARSRLAGLIPTQPAVSDPADLNHNLPTQITSFVGRQSEITAVKQLLRTSRLLSLRGPPGTGKTRLAVQVASQLLDQYQDGVFFIDLAPISDPQLVLSTIAQEFDLKEAQNQPLIDTLIHHLHDKQMLVILDNFEQVIEAASLVSDILAACPGLKILVTSREPLHIYGEQEYPVPPLAVPEPSRPISLQEVAKYEAVELFSQRARAVQPGFTLSEGNVSSVSEICARLDGLPLAIELAAARSNLLSPESMCARLESRLRTLTGGARDLPPRMQTLRAAIDWSYDLLNQDEQRLINSLSVFQGGRTIEAVEAICDLDLSLPVLDRLESLLNKNLLYSEKGKSGEMRFLMLETIHEYAREKLAHSGEAGELSKRHAEYFVVLAERAEVEFNGVRQAYWYAHLTDELDNVRTVLNWALENKKFELGARLVAALREFWYTKGILSESSIWIERALENEEEISPTVRAKMLNTSSRLAYASGDHAAGVHLARQALSIAQDTNDQENCAWAYLFLSAHLMFSDDRIEEAITYAEECLNLFQELDLKFGIAFGLNMLGELARLEGDYPHAGRLYEECLVLSKQTGDKLREAISLGNLSFVAYHQNEYNLAIDYCKRALAISSSLQMRYVSAIILAMIAGPIGAKGDPKRATRLLAAAETQLEAMGASIQAGDQHEVDLFKYTIREQLGETDFNKAWADGQAMTMEQAIAEALEGTSSSPP